MHDLDVAHADLKPGNVLIVHPTPDGVGLDSSSLHLKLCDFGFSSCASPNGPRLRAFQGTPAYLAPEACTPADASKGYRGKPVDMWAYGCVVYELLHRRLAFSAQESFQLENRIRAANHAPFDQGTPAGAKALVAGCLQVSTPKRLTCSEALAKPWLRDAPRAEMTERTADVGEARAHEAAEVDGANNNETSRGDAGRTAQMPHDGASEDGSHDARASLRQRRSMKALSKRTAVHLQAGEVEVPCEVQHHDLQLVQVGKPEAEREGEPSRGAEAEDFHSPPETRPFWESWFR